MIVEGNGYKDELNESPHSSSAMSLPSLSPRAPLVRRIVEVFGTSWDLGLVMFGGPPVHFQIVSFDLW